MENKKFSLFVVLILSALFVDNTKAQLEVLSGLRQGSYHRFANDIKKISNVELDVKTSAGSIDNFNQLTKGERPLITFLQYDVLIYKKYKDRENNTHFTDNLKVLLPLAKEEIHLITRDDSKIYSLKDLKGKRVAVGAENQGTNITASLIKGIRKVAWIDVPIGFDDAFDALLDRKVDAIFYVGYAPATKLYRLPMHAKIKLVPIRHRKLQAVYNKAVIPAGIYKWADYNVQTYAVKSVLATNISADDRDYRRDIKRLLKDIKKSFPELQSKGHPKWSTVDFNFSKINFPIYPEAPEIFQQD
jgi:uncharacterized protein